MGVKYIILVEEEREEVNKRRMIIVNVIFVRFLDNI